MSCQFFFQWLDIFFLEAWVKSFRSPEHAGNRFAFEPLNFRSHNTQYAITFRKLSVFVFLWIKSTLKSI